MNDMEIKLHSFLTSAPDRGELLVSWFSCFTSRHEPLDVHTRNMGSSEPQVPESGAPLLDVQPRSSGPEFHLQMRNAAFVTAHTPPRAQKLRPCDIMFTQRSRCDPWLWLLRQLYKQKCTAITPVATDVMEPNT